MKIYKYNDFNIYLPFLRGNSFSTLINNMTTFFGYYKPFYDPYSAFIPFRPAGIFRIFSNIYHIRKLTDYKDDETLDILCKEYLYGEPVSPELQKDIMNVINGYVMLNIPSGARIHQVPEVFLFILLGSFEWRKVDQVHTSINITTKEKKIINYFNENYVDLFTVKEIKKIVSPVENEFETILRILIKSFNFILHNEGCSKLNSIMLHKDGIFYYPPKKEPLL